MSLRVKRIAPTAGLFALALVAAATYAARPSAHVGSADSEVAAQDVIGLERRISLIEQRLNTIELSITRLEQQSRLAPPPTTTTNARDTELLLLRSEVELLKRRMAEDECGLIRLDERTLTQAARETRHKEEAGREDPCRLSPEVPLRLSPRQ